MIDKACKAEKSRNESLVGSSQGNNGHETTLWEQIPLRPTGGGKSAFALTVSRYDGDEGATNFFEDSLRLSEGKDCETYEGFKSWMEKKFLFSTGQSVLSSSDQEERKRWSLGL